MKIPQWFLRILHTPEGYVGFNQRNRDQWVEETVGYHVEAVKRS